MNKLNRYKRTQAVNCLVEGCSLRATNRMTGVHRTTIQNLLVALGDACAEFQDRTLRNLPCKRVQCDEIWSFVHSKAKNVPADHEGEFGIGDVWTWTAICPDSKIVPCWMVGPRNAVTAYHFMHKLRGRLAKRVQLTTDGLKAYLEATESAFGAEVDFAQLVKLYGNEGDETPERKYSPAECTGTRKKVISGNPRLEHVSTSGVERQNLTMRMSMRRFTRLTNGFSKKLQNHEAAISLHFMHYNFARIHQTIRCTPAMEAGVSDHVWSVDEIVSLLD